MALEGGGDCRGLRDSKDLEQGVAGKPRLASEGEGGSSSRQDWGSFWTRKESPSEEVDKNRYKSSAKLKSGVKIF